MADVTVTLNKLTAPDLLNLIDKLHEIGIQDEIPLPQIIVIGSQSSGKSSVLEAISRLSFPRGQGLTTTFATEIALRKSDEVSIRARIVPAKQQGLHRTGPGRSKLQEQVVTSWSRTLDELKPEDVAKLITDARNIINQNSTRGPMSFSFDKLRIEASGPDFPMLTLIDLPGLILTPNDNQTKQDVQDAEEIVKHYMKNKQSLMLAIISAETELVNQRSLELASEFDPKGSRTIAIITKPDLLPEKHPRTKYLIKCAKGEVEQRKLLHGWFVLKNGDFDAADLAPEQRDLAEALFFEQSEWAEIGAHRTGVEKLRNTLSRLQEVSVRAALPDVIDQIEQRLSQCRAESEKLGPPRAKEQEQRAYLGLIAKDFSKLVQQAVQGDYTDDDFFDGDEDDEPTELRTVLDSLYAEFVEDMNKNGRKSVLVMDADKVASIKASLPADQEVLTINEMLERVRKMDKRFGGGKLPGMIDEHRLVGRLVVQQTKKWESIALKHVEKIYTTILSHLCHVAEYLTSKDTATKIQMELIRKPMAIKLNQITDKTRELAAPYRYLRPITQHPLHEVNVFADNSYCIQQVPSKDIDFRNKQKMQRHALILNHFMSYYDIAMLTFIDNVIILALEMIVLRDLHEIFTRSTVLRIDERRLAFVTSEPIEEQQHRDRVTSRLSKLRGAKKICDDYQHGIFGTNTECPSTPGLSDADDFLSPGEVWRGPRTPIDVDYHTGSPKAPRSLGKETVTHVRA